MSLLSAFQPRLLFLLPFTPRLDATHGGSRAMAQFIMSLPPEYPIALVYLRALDEPPLDEVVQARCDRVEVVLRAWTGTPIRQRILRLGRMLLSLVFLRPLWVTDVYSPMFAERLQEVVQSWKPDIIELEFHLMGQYLPSLGACRAPRVLVEYEPGITAAPYLKMHISLFSPLVDRLDQLAQRRFESALLEKVQAVVAFSAHDQRALEALGRQTPITIIPRGTVIPEHPLHPTGRPPLSLLFIGSYIHPPNIEAALHLARNIFPEVKKQFPELQLYLVGQQPPGELSQLDGLQIHVTGKVPDLAPYLDQAALFVAPIYSGGGMRIKIIETLAAGKAIVATPLAAEGLALTDRKEIYLASSNSEIAARVIELLNDTAKRESLARNARAWACANLGWEHSIQAYETLYRQLLSRI